MRILIVDDHEVVREGLVGALGPNPRHEVVGAVATAADAIRRAKRTLPEAALLDLRLHDMASSHIGTGVPTPQQQHVLELAADGLTNGAIGARLLISESTVRFHLQNMKVKLGARSKTDLIARAIRAGMISPAEEDVAQP